LTPSTAELLQLSGPEVVRKQSFGALLYRATIPLQQQKWVRELGLDKQHDFCD